MQLPYSKPYLIISWHRPPGDSVGILDKIGKVLSYLNKEGTETIHLGDINCDLTIRASEFATGNNSKYIDSLYELFTFKQLIEKPTRVTPN